MTVDLNIFINVKTCCNKPERLQFSSLILFAGKLSFLVGNFFCGVCTMSIKCIHSLGCSMLFTVVIT